MGPRIVLFSSCDLSSSSSGIGTLITTTIRRASPYMRGKKIYVAHGRCGYTRRRNLAGPQHRYHARRQRRDRKLRQHAGIRQGRAACTRQRARYSIQRYRYDGDEALLAIAPADCDAVAYFLATRLCQMDTIAKYYSAKRIGQLRKVRNYIYHTRCAASLTRICAQIESVMSFISSSAANG
jgi:hypothetical protein